MTDLLLIIDAGVRFALWLLPGLMAIVIVLLAFSLADRRRDARNKEKKSDQKSRYNDRPDS
ncbi:MAG: hypothetical protein JW828_00835 [Sedimentisphaerales bacterium]|nr:hypothetical protein [Sedimentisphaerales bacterium]